MPITDHAPTLAVTLLMAIIYLVVVRLVDLNEKEPLWAVGMMFVLGGLSACVLALSVNLAVLELQLVPAVLAKELARFVAIAVGVGVLTLVAVRRGWSEINGLMDGVVYGAAGGLGYATGAVFIRDLMLGPATNLAGLESAPLSGYGLGSLALIGLSDGIFGAMMGIGFAAAVHARTALHRALFPLVSYAAAVSAHVSYDYLAHGNSLGAETVVRRWAALLLPAMVVIGVMAVALTREKKAIREELVAEADTGVVTKAELGVLQSFFAREALYFKTLFRGQFGMWAALRGLHNRQVQLALAKRRAAQSGKDKPGGPASPEVQQLRIAVVELKNSLEPAIAADAKPPPAAAAAEPPTRETSDADAEEAPSRRGGE